MILGTRVTVEGILPSETEDKRIERFTGTLRGMGFVAETDGKIQNLYIIERDEGHYDPSGGYVKYTVVCPEYVKEKL